MADLCCTYTYAGLTLNPAQVGEEPAAGLYLDEEDGVTGLDGAPIRSQIDPKGQTDGGIVHTKRFAHRIIVFKGFFLTSEDTRDVRLTEEYRDELLDLQDAARSALEGQLNSESSLAWTPANDGGGRSISCTYGIEGGEWKVGGTMVDPTWTFTLVADDPNISGD